MSVEIRLLANVAEPPPGPGGTYDSGAELVTSFLCSLDALLHVFDGTMAGLQLFAAGAVTLGFALRRRKYLHSAVQMF